jgi:tRNA(Ile)-lysidine synthetase-like protein
MDAVREALFRAVDRGFMPCGGSILLAVSGGADSMALLHAAAEVAPSTGWALSVAHVHHGWRDRDADRDLGFVADLAKRLALPFFHRRRDARAVARRLGLSPEAAARRVRYEALLEMARDAGASWIATAHQRDDVIETHLLARERNGGLASLAGPRERRADGVVRPLLGVSRSEILEFLTSRGITWRRDASNGDLSLARNRVRRELVIQDVNVEALSRRVEALGRRREELDAAFERNIRPALAFGRNVVIAAAPVLESSPDELRRKALLECAIPFARPGKPPFTGREREQIIALLASGRDFRFEAGRRIRFRRRGARFSVRLAPSGAQKGHKG